MTQLGPPFRIIVAAAGNVRTRRPQKDAASGDWFRLDGQLWMPRPADLTEVVRLANGGDPAKASPVDITFDLNTLALRASDARAETLPQAQVLIDRVAGHIDRALMSAMPRPCGPLPAPVRAGIALPMPNLAWPDPVTGWRARAVRWVRRLATGFGWSAPDRAENAMRNKALLQTEAALSLRASVGISAAMTAPDAGLVDFAHRLHELAQPMDLRITMVWSQDRTSVTVALSQTGRIDLLCGAGTLHRTRKGLEVVRIDGPARDLAISSWMVARLVIVARCFEACWGGAPPPLVATLTAAGLPGTAQASLTVDAAGWGFGLAVVAHQFPLVPDVLPDRLSLRIVPVETPAR